MVVPTLYHGTDARVLKMSQDEIKSFKQGILDALDYLWPFFEPYTTEHTHTEYNQYAKRNVFVLDSERLKEPLCYDQDPTIYDEMTLAISVNRQRIRNHAAWQYDGLYLTNWDFQAFGYAKRAYCFGELGLIAQRLIRAAHRIQFSNWNPDAKIAGIMEKIMAFSEDKSEPIIVVLDNLDIKHLKDCDGKPLKDGAMSRVFMYDGPINLADYPILTEPKNLDMTKMLEYKDGSLIESKW